MARIEIVPTKEASIDLDRFCRSQEQARNKVVIALSKKIMHVPLILIEDIKFTRINKRKFKWVSIWGQKILLNDDCFKSLKEAIQNAYNNEYSIYAFDSLLEAIQSFSIKCKS